jgi:predicted tellurium resistance membrane protein TerC
MLELVTSPEAWIAFATLSALEIVLGVDNIVFIAILAGRLPVDQRESARRMGLAGAFVTRLGLLGMISWIVQLQAPLVHIAGRPLSGKALILLGGGLFLLYKATKEIHHKVELASDEGSAIATTARATFAGVIVQIMLLDMVFSIDSVITAVGMSPYIAVMIAANVVALVVMLIVGRVIGDFVERHPSVKILALGFLLMIGLVLVCEGVGYHIPKATIYAAMGFAVFVELINLRTTRRATPSTSPGVTLARDVEGHLPARPPAG